MRLRYRIISCQDSLSFSHHVLFFFLFLCNLLISVSYATVLKISRGQISISVHSRGRKKKGLFSRLMIEIQGIGNHPLFQRCKTEAWAKFFHYKVRCISIFALSSVLSGPGRRMSASSGPSKPRRSAPGAPSHQQSTEEWRRRASSVNRYAATHKQPSLPRSGAQHLARTPANVNMADQAFMRTPESGVCG